MLVGDLEIEQLTVRPLGEIEIPEIPGDRIRRAGAPRIEGETPIKPLPQLLGTEIGGLAARGFDSDLRLEVYALAGGSFSGGMFGQPLAFNELYKLTLRPDEDGNYTADGEWQFVADFADGIAGIPNNNVIPLFGLASMGDGLYSIDASNSFTGLSGGARGEEEDCYTRRYTDIVALQLPFSGGAGSYATSLRIPHNDIAQDVFGLYTFAGDFMAPAALDGSNDRGSVFAAIGGLQTSSDRASAREIDLGWANQFFDRLPQFAQGYGFIEFDPRNKFIAQTIYYGEGSAATPDSGLFFNGSAIDGLAFEDGKLVATGRGEFYDGNSEQYGFGRFFLTIDPDTGAVDAFEPEFSGSGGSSRPILGLAGSNYGEPPAPAALSARSESYDELTIDREFADLAYSDRAIGLDPERDSGGSYPFATPFSALYTLHIIDTALDPDAAARSIELDNIPGALADHTNQVGGVGAATFDLRDPLPPGHPLAGINADRGVDVRFVGLTANSGGSGGSGGSAQVFATLGNRDLRDYPVNGIRTDALPSYLFESYVEGGHTTREVSGAVRDRLLFGGNAYTPTREGDYDLYVVAYNEVFEIDTTSGSPSWTLLGKFLPEDFEDNRADSGGGFWNPGDSYSGYNWPVLTGLSALGADDYAISHDARIFRLNYPDLGASGGSINGTLTEMADLRWDFGGALATAESRGSLFAVGQFEGIEPSTPVRGGSGNFQALSDLVVYEIDPRNAHVKDAWWGFAGDFETGLATTWGSFDSWQGAKPTQIVTIQGASFVEGGADNGGTLIISGDFYFEPSGDPKATGKKGRRGKSRNATRGFYDQAYLGININADGTTRSPYLMRIDSNEGIFYAESGWIGLASDRDSSGSASASITLAEATGAKDFATLGESFSRLSYNEAALRSGAIQQVFASEFAKSVPGVNHAELLANPLLEQALSQFVGQEDGIAQATAYLQTALGAGAITQSQGAIDAGAPSTGLDPALADAGTKAKGKGKKGKTKAQKMSNAERRRLLDRLRLEAEDLSRGKGRKSRS